MKQEYDTVVDFQTIPDSKKLLGLQLLKRVDNLALYVTDVYSFEIHMIQAKEDYNDPFSKTLYKEIEMLASTHEFGVWAWCYDRLSTVTRYFGVFGEHADEILNRLDQLGFVYTEKVGEVKHGYLF